MPKFYGAIGYGYEEETAPGVYEPMVHERMLYGDVVRNTRRMEAGEKVNNDISVGNSISVVADAYAMDHFFAIKYVMWSGAAWEVQNVTVEHPRLVLRLGGIYNGPKAPAADTP